MALGDSIVGICNAALVSLGEPPISSLNDPTKAAILCSTKYDQVRREVLAGFQWGCASQLVSLAAAAQAMPAGGYANAYPLPANCLRVFDLPDHDDAAWDVRNPFGTGRCIVTNEDAPLNALIVFDLQDPTQFEPLLAKAIARALAAELAEPLTGSDDKKKDARADAAEIADTGRLASAQEGSSRAWDEDIWLRSRR